MRTTYPQRPVPPCRAGGSSPCTPCAWPWLRPCLMGGTAAQGPVRVSSCSTCACARELDGCLAWQVALRVGHDGDGGVITVGVPEVDGDAGHGPKMRTTYPQRPVPPCRAGGSSPCTPCAWPWLRPCLMGGTAAQGPVRVSSCSTCACARELDGCLAWQVALRVGHDGDGGVITVGVPEVDGDAGHGPKMRTTYPQRACQAGRIKANPSTPSMPSACLLGVKHSEPTFGTSAIAHSNFLTT